MLQNSSKLSKNYSKLLSNLYELLSNSLELSVKSSELLENSYEMSTNFLELLANSKELLKISFDLSASTSEFSEEKSFSLVLVDIYDQVKLYFIFLFLAMKLYVLIDLKYYFAF